MTISYTVANPVPMSALPTTNGIKQQFLAVTTNPADATYAPDGLAAAPITDWVANNSRATRSYPAELSRWFRMWVHC